MVRQDAAIVLEHHYDHGKQTLNRGMKAKLLIFFSVAVFKRFFIGYVVDGLVPVYREYLANVPYHKQLKNSTLLKTCCVRVV